MMRHARATRATSAARSSSSSRCSSRSSSRSARFVIGIGNWYTHGKHLQTKADAGAFAGGDRVGVPVRPADRREDRGDGARLRRTRTTRRSAASPTRTSTRCSTGPTWYDNDSQSRHRSTSPPSNPLAPRAICDAKILDVKVTEDNSFPLASLIPLFPDIKRKARVEIQEAEAISGLLPIAVRAPEPVSAAAVFYNEANGRHPRSQVLRQEATGILGLPSGLQGWTTEQHATTRAPGRVRTAGRHGRGDRGQLPRRLQHEPAAPATRDQTKIPTRLRPCFEDTGYVGERSNGLCNQGSDPDRQLLLRDRDLAERSRAVRAALHPRLRGLTRANGDRRDRGART